jgi:hypothetical protein
MGFYPAGLPGPRGNRETFIWLAEAHRPEGIRDAERVRAIAAQAEPDQGSHATPPSA